MRRAEELLGAEISVAIPDSSPPQAARSGDLADAILGVVTRHPMREKELQVLFSHWSAAQVLEAIRELEDLHKIQSVERGGQSFWSAAEAHYPGE